MSKGPSTIGELLAELTNARPEDGVATTAGTETDKGLLNRLTEDVRTGITHIADQLDAMKPLPAIPTQWLLEQAAIDRRTPLSAKGILLGGLLYGILPLDLIPDLLPLLGIADDAVVLLTVIFAFLHLTKDIRKKLIVHELA